MTNTWEAGQAFYWSIYDRFRLIELVFEKERKEAGFTHQALADQCNTPYVKPYHLTMIQNLTRTINDKRHRIDRNQLLISLTWGLKLPKWKVDLILALFDGNALSEDEYVRYLSPYDDKRGSTLPVCEEQLRSDCLRVMEELLAKWSVPNHGPVSVSVSLLSARPSNLQDFEMSTLVLESQPGMRLVIDAGLSRVIDPYPETAEEFAQRLGLGRGGSALQDGDALSQRLEIQRKRQEVFLKTLEQYGITGIHSKTGIKSLLTQEDEAGRKQVRRQIERMTDLLWRYDRFNVGLAEHTPALELKIVGFDWARMRGASDLLFGQANWGPSVVLWNDPQVVLLFVKDFWENFYKLPAVDRDKGSVIQTLCDLAELPHPQHREARISA